MNYLVSEESAFKIIDKLIRENNAAEVVWNRCYEPAVIKRDKGIKEHLKNQNIQVKSFNSALLLEPQDTLKEDKTNYKVKIAGARNKNQLMDIEKFIKVLMFLYIQSYHYQNKEYTKKIENSLYKIKT